MARDPPRDNPEARIGETLQGKWHVDHLLGVGGMGAVYATTHRNGRKAAIKILHARFAADRDVRKRWPSSRPIAGRRRAPCSWRCARPTTSFAWRRRSLRRARARPTSAWPTSPCSTRAARRASWSTSRSARGTTRCFGRTKAHPRGPTDLVGNLGAARSRHAARIAGHSGCQRNEGVARACEGRGRSEWKVPLWV